MEKDRTAVRIVTLQHCSEKEWTKVMVEKGKGEEGKRGKWEEGKGEEGKRGKARGGG